LQGMKPRALKRYEALQALQGLFGLHPVESMYTIHMHWGSPVAAGLTPQVEVPNSQQ
jgi:hypothetical protein